MKVKSLEFLREVDWIGVSDCYSVESSFADRHDICAACGWAADEIERLQAEAERLQTEHARALAAVDGVDYREGHYRDNTTPDELRCIVLGLALKIERLDALLHRGLGKGM